MGVMSTINGKAIGYYADFLVYPLVLVGLAASSVAYATPMRPLAWLAAVLVGLFVWSLAEYIIHRFVLHNVIYFRGLHDTHHATPTALIGTPIWMSFGILVVAVLLPSWWLLGFELGNGFTFGMTTGYLAYSFAHHILHHWRILPGSYLYRVKHRHALHHFRQDEGNFGVTTLFWDHVFGTALSESPKTRNRAKS